MAKESTRAKVYCLTDDGQWDDKGTGQVAVDYLEESEDICVFVTDEIDSDTLLVHHISSDDIYMKLDDRIISWKDPGFSTEIALSFQDRAGFSYIWGLICNARGEKLNAMDVKLKCLANVQPPNLHSCVEIVCNCEEEDQRKLSEFILNDDNFFPNLMDLFRNCEENRSIDHLHMIFKIVKEIISLRRPSILAKVLGDEFILDVIGSLEYNPRIPNTQHYRKFLKEYDVLNKVLPIKDPRISSKIHQSYQVRYMKDVIFPKVLDNDTTISVDFIIRANHTFVVSSLKDDDDFVSAMLRFPTLSIEAKRNLVSFLYEFCRLSKGIRTTNQRCLLCVLINKGLSCIVGDALQSRDQKLVSSGIDILMHFLDDFPNALCSFLLQKEIPLLDYVVQGMVTDVGDDIQTPCFGLLRSLFLPIKTSRSVEGKIVISYLPGIESLLDIFYDKHFDRLIDIITASCPVETETQPNQGPGSDESAENENGVKPDILLKICDLLCECAVHPHDRLQCKLLDNAVLDKVLLLTQRSEKYLMVAAVRYIHRILSHQDEDVIDQFVRRNFMKPIVDAFIRNGNRKNMLHSVVLELLEFIRKDCLTPLIDYVVDSFWNDLAKFERLPTIQSFKLKYDECKQISRSVSPGTVSAEESFNKDRGDEDITSATQIPDQLPQVFSPSSLPLKKRLSFSIEDKGSMEFELAKKLKLDEESDEAK